MNGNSVTSQTGFAVGAILLGAVLRTLHSLLPWRRRPFEWLHVCADENALVAEEFARENLRRLRLAAPTIFVVKAVSA